MELKKLHRLGFKVTNKFFEKNNFNVYTCSDRLIPIITLIKSYCKEVLQKEWMANNVIKLPFILNAINPASLLINEDIYEDGNVEFYCHKSLSENEIDRMVYLITNSIEEFIEKYRNNLKEFNPNVDLDNVRIIPQLKGQVDSRFLMENLALIKVLFIRELAYKPIPIGTGKHEKFIQEGRNVIFYPSYSRQGGHMLVSEILEFKISGKTERMAYFITPNVEVQDGEIFIYPLIGIKRFVTHKRLLSIQSGTADSYSTLVFDGCFYHLPRIAYRDNKEKTNKEIKPVSEDWKLFRYLEDYKGIAIKDILNHINGEDKKNIYLVYSNKLGIANEINSGVPGCDKLDVYNYILSNIQGLEPISPIEEIAVKKQSGGLSNQDKICLNKTLFRNDMTEVELMVIHPKNSTLYSEIINIFNSEKLVKENSGLIKSGDGLYTFQISNSKTINIIIRDVPSVKGIEIRTENETTEERLKKLISEMGLKSDDKCTLALIELEYMGVYDAKSIIRKTLDGYGIVNQFINNKSCTDANKIASCIRDLLNDIGLGSLNQELKLNEVIYTWHKTSKINFICRLDNNGVEVKIPAVTNEYVHITEIYPFLSMAKKKTKDFENIDTFAAEMLLEDIEKDNRDVIVILENGETHYNTVLPNISDEIYKRITSTVKEYVTTDLLGHQEVIQTKGDRITKGSGIYKIKDGIYISIGDKGQDKTSLEASKVRSWINKHNKISVGATIAYKDRIAYEIRMHKNNDNDGLCFLIHKLRLAMTTHMHLNRCLTTDYIIGLDKHL